MGAKGEEAGRLFLCATPIGNLEDVTLRVLGALRDSPVVAAEDTRRTRALFARYDIHTPMLSYREENREAAGAKILARLEAGDDVALVSDAGMPGISDPGHHLVKQCVERGIEVIALPGPNAALTALTVSGLPTLRFSFEGFLPRKEGARRRALAELAADERTIIFFESPARVQATLADIQEVLGDRPAALARELTKKFEEVIRGKVSEIRGELASRQIKGEIVLVLSGTQGAKSPGVEGLDEAVERVLALKGEGLSLKEAVAAVVEGAGGAISKSALYNASLKEQ